MRLRHKKVSQEGRLVYYSNPENLMDWDGFWKDQITPAYYQEYQNGHLGEYEQVFMKAFSPQDKILEAGCGTGRYLVGFQARGYKNIEGIEIGAETVKKVAEILPELPISVGDVTKIDVEDGFYDGYISLGVVEHRIEGPEPFLDEAHRVLKKGGIAVISVPYFNPLRKLKSALGCYHGKNTDPGEVEFYQYAFDPQEFSEILENSGFRVLENKGVAGRYGVKDEFYGFFRFMEKIPGGWRLESILSKYKRINEWGHMIAFICTK